MPRQAIAYFLLAVMAVFITGCTTLKEVFTGTSSELLWQAATAQVIEEGYVEPQTLVSQIEDAEDFLDGNEMAEIGKLASTLRARVNASDKPIGVKIILGQIITTYEQRLEDRIGAGVLDPEQEVQLKTVLGWVKTAAQMYGT